MSKSRVWIHFRPKLYTDLFKKIIQSMGMAEIVETFPLERRRYFGSGQADDKVDLVILSFDKRNQPDIEQLAEVLPGTKFVAFSACGDYGLRRKPGERNWEELRPFGVQQMMQEVMDTGSTDNC